MNHPGTVLLPAAFRAGIAPTDPSRWGGQAPLPEIVPGTLRGLIGCEFTLADGRPARLLGLSALEPDSELIVSVDGGPPTRMASRPVRDALDATLPTAFGFSATNRAVLESTVTPLADALRRNHRALCREVLRPLPDNDHGATATIVGLFAEPVGVASVVAGR